MEGRDSTLREVDVAVGELREDQQQAARLILGDAADDARLVVRVEVLRRRRRG